jgi:D-inositol-3-phosphate glycosyltransferase
MSEAKMQLHIAMLSVHASPIAELGGTKTGGMNVYIREFAQELSDRGISVDIYTRRWNSSDPEVDGRLGANVRVINISAGPSISVLPDQLFVHLPEFTAGVIQFANRENVTYQVIYSHYWLSGWVAERLKSNWNIPFVQMFHTLGHMKNRITVGTSTSPLPDQRTLTETQIMRWADCIVAATPAEHAQLLWLYRADRRKIEIVSPGVNPERFHPISADLARKALALPDDVQILLFVGRIEPLKAVDSILQAMQFARRKNPNRLQHTRLIIIGGNPDNPSDSELQHLQQYAQELGIDDLTAFVGAKDQTELRTYYAAALAVIMPSEYESFGMVALEAMASGTPVIASHIGGLAYLVKNGETGFLVPVREPQQLADRILTLLENPAIGKEMGVKAATVAQNYSWSTIADQLLHVFASVQTKYHARH